MTTEIMLFLTGQAIVLLLAIVSTYVKLAVRLKEIELTLQHTDSSSESNATELRALRSDLQALTLKVEHVQTTQQMFCATCPLRGPVEVDVMARHIGGKEHG